MTMDMSVGLWLGLGLELGLELRLQSQRRRVRQYIQCLVCTAAPAKRDLMSILHAHDDSTLCDICNSLKSIVKIEYQHWGYKINKQQQKLTE